MDVPIAPFAPDLAPLESSAASYLLNVLAESKNSYSPCKSLQAQTSALTARCQGAASFRGTDGTVVNFAGDATKLYKQSAATYANVSRLVGGAYTITTDSFWQFARFGQLVLAANGIDAMQSFTIASSTNFAAAAGSPPIARHIATARSFVFAGNLSTDQGAVQWCAFENPASWPIGSSQGDVQSFPDSGKVVGLAGGQGITIFLENGIFGGTYLGVDPWWQFDSLSDERGCAASGSIARFQRLVFFLDYSGFFLLSPAGIQPIGEQWVDNSFWNGSANMPGVNIEYLHRVTSVCDPVHKLYYVAYPSVDSADGTPDRMLIYNWSLDRWTAAAYDLEYLFRARTGLGKTLEDLDADYPGGLETIPVSLDSYLFAGTPQETLAAFDTAHKAAFFQGATLAATVDSIEAQVIPGRKARIRTVRPIVTGGAPTVRIGVRDNKLNDTMRFTDPITQRTTGRCPFANKRTKGRFHKARFEMAAGQVWEDFQGFDFDAVEAGGR